MADLAQLDNDSLLNSTGQKAASAGTPGLGPDLQMQQFAQQDAYNAQVAGLGLNPAGRSTPTGDPSVYLAAPAYTVSGSNAASGGLVGAVSSKLGQPYALGAAIGSGSWDCGSLISWAFAQNGVKGVNRYVPAMLQDPRFHGVSGGVQNAQPGDVLFPTGGYGTSLGDHVVMYIGNGRIIEAPHRGAPVRIMPLSEYTGYVVKRYGG